MQNETMVTVTGNVATEVELRETAAGVPVARFRLATTVRRFDRERRGWTDAHTSFYTVWAWRSLARNVKASVVLGEPVVVSGKLRVWERGPDDGRPADTSIEALTLGHDLAHGTSAFARIARAKERITARSEEATPACAGRVPPAP